jgi:polysaccharide deacetylase 2 family uncharacterized protein YibQ
MTKTKKKARSTKKKRRRQSIFLSLIPPLAGGLLFAALFFHLSRGSNQGVSPVFEEESAFTSKLHHQINKTDAAIYRSFFERRIPEKNVAFVEVTPRHQGERSFDFTHIVVKCGDVQTSSQLLKEIQKNLETLAPQLKVKTDNSHGKKAVCHVYSGSYYTHRITLEAHGKLIAHIRGKGRPKIAIIIDDLGYDPHLATSFLQTNLPLSLSVLPASPFRRQVIREAKEVGCELLVHLPMEPKNFPLVKPGRDALLVHMNSAEIKEIVEKSLNRVAGAKGVNNHMGSRFTENREKMRVFLKELGRRGLFFVDSRTSNSSVGAKLAEELGIPTAERSVFLDNTPDTEAIRIQMERLLNVADHTGAAIGIGHPNKETVEVLKKYGSKLRKEYLVVPVSRIVS